MIIIACADREWGIGRDSKLLFNIPEDMEFFKNATKGKTVVMGRKTFESLRIKPL
ncbi:MAG: dihydrofolate reductase, partial [Oscillospiraceae bacterium]|nr:dihydrofolate reductase [Oscillospiraceae bacterium]